MDRLHRCEARNAHGHRCIRRLHHDKRVVKGGGQQVPTPHRAFGTEWKQ